MSRLSSRQSDYARLDEDDVRVRPGRSSRPRTRQQQAHSGAVEGFVTSVDRGRYGCMTDGRLVVAMKARELGKGSVVVGDRVALAGDISGAEGTLARIVRVEPRTSALRRSADDTDPLERIIVANADQLVIVCSLADPAPNLRFVDRCLVAAYDAGLDPLLVLTKADLASPGKVRDFYRPLGLPVLTTRRPLPARTLSRLRSALTGRISVLIGPSGVGKSTLMNTVVPTADRSVGRVNPVTGQGRHTSSSVVAIPLGDGWLIDTPGLRGFGLGSRERGAGGGGVRGPSRGHRRVPARLRSPLPAARWRSGPASTTPRRAWTRSAACCAAAKAARTRRYVRWRGWLARLVLEIPQAVPFRGWHAMTTTCASRMSSQTTPTTSPPGGSGRST